MSDTELQQLHPPKLCGTVGCGREVTARLSELGLEQCGVFGPGTKQGTWLAAAVYACECGRERRDRLKDAVPRATGYTVSHSPCRRKDDVQPR